MERIRKEEALQPYFKMLELIREAQAGLKNLGLKEGMDLDKVLKEKGNAGDKSPIMRSLRPEDFDLNEFARFYETVTKKLSEVGLLEEVPPLENPEELISRRLRGESIDPLIDNVVDGFLQPLARHIASKVELKDLASWKKQECYVCGRKPFLALKREEDIWRFKCTFCGLEIPFDALKCPYCGNDDFKKIKILRVEGRKGVEITYCENCGRYYKMVYPDEIEIPEGLEDIYTIDLDALAKQRGLVRIDE